ncbi:hypothetical protein U9M48_044144, partial [Paspalum notatum var. saurae]
DPTALPPPCAPTPSGRTPPCAPPRPAAPAPRTRLRASLRPLPFSPCIYVTPWPAAGPLSSTLATGSTPWKGRLRSHHTPPTPTWKLASQTKNQEEKELQTLNKQAAPNKTAKGGHANASRCGI